MFIHTNTEDRATILTYRAKVTTQLEKKGKKRLEQQEITHLLPVAQVF